MRAHEPRVARSDEEGYVSHVRAKKAVEEAQRRDALVRQVARVGDYIVPGDVLAEVWCEDEGADDFVSDVADLFQLDKKRGPVQDVAFPIRQLADVALKGLSPGINDPTTAENAMNAMAAALARLARTPVASSVRLDDDGRPRFLASVRDLNDLVRLGFEQVRVFAAPYPVFAVRLVELLDSVAREAATAGVDHAEIDRQIELLAEGPEGEVPTADDAERVRAAATSPRRA